MSRLPSPLTVLVGRLYASAAALVGSVFEFITFRPPKCMSAPPSVATTAAATSHIVLRCVSPATPHPQLSNRGWKYITDAKKPL
jgi:hypothetical protein